MIFRELLETDLSLIWNIDRSEYIDYIYRYSHGSLTEEKLDKSFGSWAEATIQTYSPILTDCFARGGYFFGAFTKEKLVAIAVLDTAWMEHSTLQLKFLHVDKQFRGIGLGRRLFQAASKKAKALGAIRIYISATESKHTVDFYRGLGCQLVVKPDPKLYELEPEDIHLELVLG